MGITRWSKRRQSQIMHVRPPTHTHLVSGLYLVQLHKTYMLWLNKCRNEIVYRNKQAQWEGEGEKGDGWGNWAGVYLTCNIFQ